MLALVSAAITLATPVPDWLQWGALVVTVGLFLLVLLGGLISAPLEMHRELERAKPREAGEPAQTIVRLLGQGDRVLAELGAWRAALPDAINMASEYQHYLRDQLRAHAPDALAAIRNLDLKNLGPRATKLHMDGMHNDLAFDVALLEATLNELRAYVHVNNLSPDSGLENA